MPKKLKYDPKNPLAFLDELQGVFTEMSSEYAGMMDNVPDSVKATVQALKNQVDQALVGLASRPTDQVPAAQEANWMLRSYAEVCSHFQLLTERSQEMLKKLQDALSTLKPKEVELASFQTRLTGGELLEKSAVDKLVTDKVAEALEGERKLQKLLGTRRTELLSAKLPLPGDEALAGDDAAYKAVFETAKTRMKTLTDKGLASTFEAGELTELCYGPAKEYDRTIKLAEKFGTTGGSGGASGEPLMGGGEDKNKPTTTKGMPRF